MAPTVANACAALNDKEVASSALNILKWMPMPVNPTRQNNRKRAETASLVTFAVTRAAKSSAILEFELALAVLAFAERRWQFDRAQLAPCRRQYIEQDFETLRGEGRRDRLDGFATDHEMAAHRISELDPEQQTHNRIRSAADARALLGEAGGGPAVEIAAGNDDIGASGAQGIEHGNEQLFVMLEVGVHHRDIAGLAREHAFEARSGETAAADAANAAYATVGFADGARGGSRTVRRIVVDEDNFPVTGGEKP